jgi:hypothetical protein
VEKAYNIKKIYFENDYLIIEVDDQIIKVKFSEVSDRLKNASDQERNDFKISPSGYGIHWMKLDEDLSINGLLKMK